MLGDNILKDKTIDELLVLYKSQPIYKKKLLGLIKKKSRSLENYRKQIWAHITMKKRIVYNPEYSVNKVPKGIMKMYDPDLVNRVKLLENKGFDYELSSFTPYGIRMFPEKLINEIKKLNGNNRYIISNNLKLVLNTM